MCDDGGRVYQNKCVIGTGGWLKAVSTMQNIVSLLKLCVLNLNVCLSSPQ